MSPLIRIVVLFLLVIHSLCSDQSTRINFGSCNHQDNFQPRYAITWESIISRNPDLWIWTGDVVYLDHDVTKSYPHADYNVLLYVFNAFLLDNQAVSDPKTWVQKYEKMKKNIAYQNLKNLTTIIGVWDDHDIGENNADFTWNHKDYAQILFYDFMQIPKNHSKRAQKGVYDFYEMHNLISVNNMTYNKTIDIIMFDTRYFAKQDGEENILGNVQWEWVEDILQNKLHGELLIVISAVQMMNNPPLNSREGWYKYEKDQQKLFRLLKEYNTNDRLLLISGDVHRSEIMHCQCIGNDHETYDFYEITSSGLTHAMFYESPYLEKFSYTLDDYAREDGITGCSWLGRNFGEINIDWYYDSDTSDVKIRNVSVEIRDEKGDVKCMLDLPLFGDSDVIHQYDDDSNDLWTNDYHTCYGAETFHSRHGVRSVQALCGLSWVIMIMYPNVFLLIFMIVTIEAIIVCCCACDFFGTAEPPRLRSDTAGGDSIHNPNLIGRNDEDGCEFNEDSIDFKSDPITEVDANTNDAVENPTIDLHEAPNLEEDATMIINELDANIANAKNNSNIEEVVDKKPQEFQRVTTLSNNEKQQLDRDRKFSFVDMIRRKTTSMSRKHTNSHAHNADPSLVNPQTLYEDKSMGHTDAFHSHSYYHSYGYIIFKNTFYYYLLISIIFLMGFNLIGPYNTEYTANIFVLIAFGIIYCCSEMCLGFYCVYAFEIAKKICIVTCGIGAVCIVISFIQYKEILISLFFVLADCISIFSSIFVISHGYMKKHFILIIAFQIIVTGHKIYSLGSHLLYIHNDVPGHTGVGWFWIVQICLIKCYLSQFIFRSKLEYITDILYDHLLVEHGKYRKFEILFPVLLAIVFGICSFYMATNTNDWVDGYVSVGTFLEFSFMFNWPSTIYLFLWFWLKRYKIPKSHAIFHKQITFKNLSLKMKEEFGNIASVLQEYNQEVGQMSPNVDLKSNNNNMDFEPPPSPKIKDFDENKNDNIVKKDNNMENIQMKQETNAENIEMDPNEQNIQNQNSDHDNETINEAAIDIEMHHVKSDSTKL